MEKLKPTDAELEILQILWAKGPSTVREVHDILSVQKEAGYTTTLKIMQLMLEKGLVSREASGKFHIYQAAIAEEPTQNSLLSRFIDTTFRGEAMKLVMQTLGNHQVSKSEADEIRKLLDSLE